jgi:hypothetical protein
VERGNMHSSFWKEGLQAWGWVSVDDPGRVLYPLFNFEKREDAVEGLREGWVLAKIQYHNDNWEIVKFYDDRPRVQATVDPWKKESIESRGIWLESIALEELKVKDDM